MLVDVSGVQLLLIKLRETRPRDKIDFDLSPLIRLHALTELWLIGYGAQSYVLKFMNTPT